MERLTEKERNFNGTGRSKRPLIEERKGLTFLTEHTNKVMTKLADYEDAEEAGLLIHLPSKTVYHIVDQYTSYGPMVMATRIIDLTIAEIMGIDKDGKYWSTREAAEKALEAMKK